MLSRWKVKSIPLTCNFGFPCRQLTMPTAIAVSPIAAAPIKTRRGCRLRCITSIRLGPFGKENEQTHSAQRLRSGPLEPHLDDFAALLQEQGYSRQAGQQKLRLAADLSRWLQRKRLPVEELEEERFREFFDARWRRRRWHNSDQSSLSLLLSQLRQAKVIPDKVVATSQSPLDRVEQDYARFLIQERGLLPTTLASYLPDARRFLVSRFGSGKLRLKALCSNDVSEFIRWLHACSGAEHP